MLETAFRIRIRLVSWSGSGLRIRVQEGRGKKLRFDGAGYSLDGWIFVLGVGNPSRWSRKKSMALFHMKNVIFFICGHKKWIPCNLDPDPGSGFTKNNGFNEYRLKFSFWNRRLNAYLSSAQRWAAGVGTCWRPSSHLFPTRIRGISRPSPCNSSSSSQPFTPNF